jgi:hypothetical protein
MPQSGVIMVHANCPNCATSKITCKNRAGDFAPVVIEAKSSVELSDAYQAGLTGPRCLATATAIGTFGDWPPNGFTNDSLAPQAFLLCSNRVAR